VDDSHCVKPVTPRAKNEWLTSGALEFRTMDPDFSPPILFNAPAIPSGLRVNWTAGVSQVFSLPADCGLDRTPEKCSGKADRHQPDCQRQNCGTAIVVAAPASRKRGRIHQVVAQNAQNQDTVQSTHQADIEPHVAIEYVTEFMGDDALQLIPAELLDCSLRNSEEHSESDTTAALIVQKVHGNVLAFTMRLQWSR
jgi:hypothetical protein